MTRVPKDNRGFAREAMLWLSFAYRPLTLPELCETLAFNESDATVDQSDRLLDAHDLLRWCQGLITYHSESSNITLSHSSVRTYLLSDQIKDGPSSFFSIEETVAERLLLRKCLTYVMFSNFSKGYCSNYLEWEAVIRQWPLLRYAAQNWASHAHALDARMEPYDQELISKFHSTSNYERGGNFGFWVQCLSPRSGIRVAQETQPLYYAASYGLRAVVNSLICGDRSMDINASSGGRTGWTALQAACYRGHYGVAKDLLEAGANPYCKDRFGQTALFLSLCRGDQETAELIRQHLRSNPDPKGEAASTHIKEAFAAARTFLQERSLC